MANALDILVPTCTRPAALAVMLTSLIGQHYRDFRIVISDQTETGPRLTPELQAVLRVLECLGHPVQLHVHLPRRGMAEQRHFLLEHAQAPYALYLDDDLVLEPTVVARLMAVMERERCGFVGCAPIGLSFLADVRPQEQAIEFWEGRIEPEQITPGSRQWDRHRLHNAANLHHLQRRLGLSEEDTRCYRVAWIGACVLYDVKKLRAVGGFGFWRELPREHAGEDVLAQLRVMARFGGCGIIPSGVYHQELPTTIANRQVDAPKVLAV